MVNEKKKILVGVTAICVSASLWGFDGVVLTPRLYNLDVSFVVLMLHLIPFTLMNLFLYKEYKNAKEFQVKDWAALIGISLFGGALGTLSIVKALFLVNFQHLSFVVLLQKLQPVFAIGLAALLLKEKLRPGYILWGGLAILAGYFLTFGVHAPEINTNENTLKAAFYALTAAFSFGSSTVFSKIALNKCKFTTATFYRYGITSIIMLLIVSFSGKWQSFSAITPTNWLIFVCIALTTGSGALFLYYYGLTKVKAIIATICELLFPLSAILFDYLINDSVLSPVQWLSALVMLISIINLNADNAKAVQRKANKVKQTA